MSLYKRVVYTCTTTPMSCVTVAATPATSAIPGTAGTPPVRDDSVVWRDFLKMVQETPENTTNITCEYVIEVYSDENPDDDRKETVVRPIVFCPDHLFGTRVQMLESQFGIARHTLICLLMLPHVSTLHDAEAMKQDYTKEYDQVLARLSKMIELVLATMNMKKKQKAKIMPAVKRRISDGTECLKKGPKNEDWNWNDEFQIAKHAVIRYDKRVHDANKAYDERNTNKAHIQEPMDTDSDSESEAAT